LEEEMFSKPSLLKQKIEEDSFIAILFAFDIPFLSILNFSDEFLNLLIGLRCPQIILHHESHQVFGISKLNNPFQVHIYDNWEGAFLIKGPRILFEVPITENLNWTDSIYKAIGNRHQNRIEDQDLVLDIEKQFRSSQWKLMDANKRTYDRALIFIQDISAWAVIEYLSQRNIIFRNIETPSLIKWRGMKTMNWFTSTRVPVPDLRFLFVIPVEILKLKSFKTEFQDAINEIRTLQGT
jgi:hypothetical protein